jgi:UDP-glucose 4-epimerase
MSATVLLVGGFGNLGGRIAAHLSQFQNHQIVLASRKKRAAPIWAKDAQTIQLDVTDPTTFTNIPKSVNCIVQLAATNDVDSAQNPELARTVTTEGTASLLNAAIHNEIERFVYFSTAHVYGAPLQGTFNESSPTHAVHPYATTHLEAESAVATAHERGDIQGIRVRLSNGFGRPMAYEAADWRTLTSDLCRQAVVEKRMEMRTDGLQERNFITKTDIARAVQHLIAIPTSQISDGLFNLGGSQSQTLLAMATTIQERAQKKYSIEIPLLRPEPTTADIQHLNFDIHKLLNTGLSLTEDTLGEIDDFLNMIELHHQS